MKLVRGTVWPNESSKKEWVIGVLSYAPLTDELQSAATKIKKGDKPIRVVEVANVSEALACDVVYFPSFKSKVVNTTFSSLQKQPVMIFTNTVDASKLGSSVNFVFREGKLHIEMNQAALNQSGLKVSSEIKNMVDFVN